MILTNQLVSLNFSDIPFPTPTAWDLSSFIPAGALDPTQVEARARPTGKYWQAWSIVPGFDNTTNTATWTSPLACDQVEFRRVTPRYAAYLDPLAVTSRVSQRNLQVNADQGMFVATEWAAQYGLDAMQSLLADPTDAPNQLGLVQQTQNYWGTKANYADTDWNFQFAGGYLSRSHIKAQVLLSTGWEELTIDPANPHNSDPDAPSTAPFRFIGDFQLYMDFTTLAEMPQALIIHRFTPRNVHVDSIPDDARITAEGMTPSATWSFFVAVEIGEELAKRVPPCECEQYFTSLMYPYIYSEVMSIPIPGLPHGTTVGLYTDHLGVPVVALLEGTLIQTIFPPIIYDHWKTVAPDTISIPVPILRVGELITVGDPAIHYYNWKFVAPDLMHIPVPHLTAGTLVVVLGPRSYTNWRDKNPDTLHVAVPHLLSGTLV